MATDSSTTGSLNADVPGNEAGNKARKRKEGRPLPYWIMLITALLGGAMLSVLMVMATTSAAGAGEKGYALAFGSMAGACIVLPPLIVGLVMEKMWQLNLEYHENRLYSSSSREPLNDRTNHNPPCREQ